MPIQKVSLKELYDRANAHVDLFEAVVHGRDNVNAALEPYGIQLSNNDATLLQDGLARLAPIALEFDKPPAALGGWGPWKFQPFKKRLTP
jgi:hypothetical protein